MPLATLGKNVGSGPRIGMMTHCPQVLVGHVNVFMSMIISSGVLRFRLAGRSPSPEWRRQKLRREEVQL